MTTTIVAHDLPHAGISTRAGAEVLQICAIGNNENDWWFCCKVRYPDEPGEFTRELHPCQLVHDDEGEATMHELSRMMMQHLAEHGVWDSRGRWRANK